VYALEGSVAVAGSALSWLEKNLGLVGGVAEVEELASQVETTGDVYFVPAFSGLFAPYWR
jgi:glycerol kinase